MTRQARFSIAVHEEVALDGDPSSGRSPKDLPEFCAAIVEQFVDLHRYSVFRNLRLGTVVGRRPFRPGEYLDRHVGVAVAAERE
jgi:hypothetical protein